MAGAPTSEDKDFPWWLVGAGLIGVALLIDVVLDPKAMQILEVIARGVWVTIFVTLVAFTLASALGLGLAVMALSNSRALRQIARFYVEIIRGVPMLVLLFYVAFVGAPALIHGFNALASPLIEAGWINPLQVRDFSLMWRAIIALAIGYSAFLSEIFRAGIQAVDKGQVEAGKALGLNRWQRFRHIVMPQAIRTVLPPLGNDFVAMVKDSSLVSVLGVADIAQMAKIHSAGSFLYFETYTIAAYVYLVMTIGLSLMLRSLERRLRRGWR